MPGYYWQLELFWVGPLSVGAQAGLEAASDGARELQSLATKNVPLHTVACRS